jgi:hypothetical protein
MAPCLDLFGFVMVDFYGTARDNLEFFITLERLSCTERRQQGPQREFAGLAWARWLLGRDRVRVIKPQITLGAMGMT